MTRWWQSLRVQVALLGFLAIYAPVVVLVGVSQVTEAEVTIDGVVVQEGASTERSPWVVWTVVGLAPAAAAMAWWLAGRAVRPIDGVRAVAEDIGGSDLGRRIDLDRGPVEVVALAASFDSMLDRLEQAAQAQRQLIEETSHELRTPLSVLTTNAEVLLAHPSPSLDLYRDGLERSRVTAARLQATIDELLVDARGRARTLDRNPADLLALVHDVIDDARLVAGPAGVELVVTGPRDAVCSLDEPTVRRAVANLVDNAIRFAPSGSSVEVAVEITAADASVVVTDHGPGIPPAEQDHVFERFWRSRPDTHGTGLGLPIARQVARAHGGDVTVRSPGPAGDGTAFHLRLRR